MVVDEGLLWVDNARNIRGKMAGTANRLFTVAGKKWGTSPEMLRVIYQGAVAPVLLYGAEVWGERWRDKRVRRHMDATQRPYLLAIARAYRTAPTAALQVITGIKPLGVEAGHMHRERMELQDGHEMGATAAGLVHPAERGLVTYEEWDEEAEHQDVRAIYTDGSAGDNGAGWAYVTRESDGSWGESQKVKLSGYATSTQAELLAIKGAVEAAHLARGRTYVISDSEAALKAITAQEHRNGTARDIYTRLRRMTTEGTTAQLWWTKGHAGNLGNLMANTEARAAAQMDGEATEIPKAKAYARAERKRSEMRAWQDQWDRGRTGRLLYSMVSRVGAEVGAVSADTVQLLTGHGRLRAYYRRFKLRETDGECDCGNEQETAEHVLWRCTLPARILARDELELRARECEAGWPVTITAQTSVKFWEALNAFASCALAKEDVEGTGRDVGAGQGGGRSGGRTEGSERDTGHGGS